MSQTMAPPQQAALAEAVGGALAIPAEVESPSLVVDLGRVRRNLDDMAAFTMERKIDLVPHVKTHRTPEFARLQVDAGATGICAAKISEAELFADAGFDNILVAYPIAGQDKYARAKRLLRRKAVRFCTDDVGAARAFSESLVADGLEADLLLLVDVGYHRAGVAAGDAPDIAAEIAALAGVTLRGILAHEGHAYTAPGVEGLREASLAAGELMRRTAASIRSRGIPVDVVSVGSTATAKVTTLVDGITEVRPGIYPFNDYGQVLRETVGLERCAARVLATVVSHVAANRAIIDAGSKALGQDRLSIHVPGGVEGHGLLIGLPGWHLHQLSEEHGWLQWIGRGAPTPLTVGQRVQVLPNHICSVFHVLGESTVIEDGQVVAIWTATARGCSK